MSVDGAGRPVRAGRNGDGGRHDVGVVALEHDLRQRRLLAEIEREVAQLSAAREVAGVHAERHVDARPNVSVKCSPFLSTCSSVVPSANWTVTFMPASAGRVAADRPGPAADAAEKMQARGRDGGRHLDPLREVVGEVAGARAALERDQVRAVRRPRRIHDEERHAVDRDIAEPVQRHRVVTLVLPPQPAPAVGGVGGAQVEDAEF